jgi:hypothetical protein
MKAPCQKLTAAWPLVIFLLLPTLTRAETAVQAWVQRYNGPGNSTDWPSAVAVDSSNEVIVTGISYRSGNFSDYATIKYSSAGMPLWTNRYNGPSSQKNSATALALDGSNNVIVTGYSGWEVEGGTVACYATIKYSAAGVPLWTNLYAGSWTYDYASPVAVVADGSNDVVVTGRSFDNPNQEWNYVTIKYSQVGVSLWTNRYDTPGYSYDTPTAMAVDHNNDLIVTGCSGPDPGYDYATIKYSSAGVPLWTNRYNGPGNHNDKPLAVVVDHGNDLIVTGWSDNTNGYDYATIKYSSAGVPLWTNRYCASGNSRTAGAAAMAVDGSNNVIVTGWSSPSRTANPWDCDYATIEYSSTGLALWTNFYNGPASSYDVGYAVAVDASDNVIVTGRSDASPTEVHTSDYATIKYSSAGVPLWTNRYNGPADSDDWPNAMVVDRGGNVIVAGYSAGTHIVPYNYDYATVKYICLSEPVLTSLQLTNGSFHMRVDDVLQAGTLVIEACTNLSTSLADWAPVFTNTTPTNVLFYTDPDAGSLRRRFYRAFQFP